MLKLLPKLIGVDTQRLFSSEWEQALIRIVFTAIALAYVLIKNYWGDVVQSPSLVTLTIGWSYLAFAVLVLFSFRGYPGRMHSRRILTLTTDLAIISISMYYADELGSPFFTLLMWVAVGYGARYGRRYLVLGTVMASLFFTVLLNVTPYWLSHQTIGYGLLVALLIIPVFVFKLLGRIEKARADAEEANQAKSQFLANMSHEIRTPLTAIIGMADLLMDVALGKQQQEQVRAIDASAKTLLNLLEDVLDISKIEAGKVVLENKALDLHGLVNSLSMSFKPVAHRKGLRFLTHIHPDVPYALSGDGLRLRQVLMNLLGNAIKFTDQGYVELRLSLLSRDGDEARLRFDVVDTGVGIPQVKLERIFEQFEQVDASTTREYGGTGLGTSIALHLTELMGGEIRVHSNEGRGTTFTVDVPLLVREEVPADTRDNSFQGMRALLVSNRGSCIASVTEYLQGWGIEVRTMAGSAKAFASLYGAENRGQGYGLVLVDEQGCDISPQHFAGAVVAEEHLRHLPLILVAAQQGSADSMAGYSSSVPEPLQKPLLFNAVHAALVGGREIEGVSRLSDRYGGVDPIRKALRVLVAEDNLTIQKVIRAILERGGHKVELVGNGEQALDRLEQQNYDVTIVDLQMPLLGGLDVLRAYRFGAGLGRAMPFIVLSANATPEAHRECDEAGVDAYLTKPVDPSHLLETLEVLTQDRDSIPEVSKTAVRKTAAQALLDPAELRNLLQLGHGIEFIEDLFYGFAKDAKLSIAALQESLASQTCQRFRDVAHGLAGSASGVGAMQLYDEAHAVTLMDELAIRSRGGEVAERLDQLLAQTIEAHQQYLQQLRSEHNETSNEPPI